MSNVLVIAFDGLDKELIEKFDLENIPQEEFGTMDYPDETYSIKTSELFASFITGTTHEDMVSRDFRDIKMKVRLKKLTE